MPSKPPLAKFAAKSARKRESALAQGKTTGKARVELDARLAAIAKALSKEPSVTVGKLFASLGLKADGKIFAMVVRGQLVLKLPKERVARLVTEGAGRPFVPAPGRVMKEWIVLDEPTPSSVRLGREAFAFVRGTQ